MKTRIVHLRAGQHRPDADNVETLSERLDDPAAAPGAPELRASLRARFEQGYDALRRAAGVQRVPGVAVVAVSDDGRVGGTLCLHPQPGQPACAVVGRHGRADLYLEGDLTLSLRHLLVVAEMGSDCRPLLRVLDLRTARAFEDEHGRALESLRADGPVFIRCGRWTLFFVDVSGDVAADPWPESAGAAWECLPERVYLGEHEAEPDRWRRAPREQFRRGPGIDTLVRREPGPVGLADACPDGEPRLGLLQIRTAAGPYHLDLCAGAARRGVLIGRADRCDTERLVGLMDARLSRVHLVVLESAGRLYAVDVASTNGTRGESGPARAVRLDPLVPLALAGHVAELRWIPTTRSLASGDGPPAGGAAR